MRVRITDLIRTPDPSFVIQMTSTTEHLRASDALLQIVRNFPHERISLQDLLDSLGERSFGFLLLLFGVGCAIAPPGFATILALPLLLFSLQMVAGYDSPWLPRTIGARNFARSDLEATIKRAVPAMRWVERICRPRFEFLVGELGERLLGVLVFILTIVIALPGPGTNFPPGVAIAFMSIAIIERDGLLVFLGVLVSMVALYIGFLGLQLVITEILPWLWGHVQDNWAFITSLF
jgi:hypothetical protein